MSTRAALAHLRLQIEDFDDLPHRPAAAPERCACPRCATAPRCHGETYEQGVRVGRSLRQAADQEASSRLALALSDALAVSEAQAARIADATAETIGEAVLAMAMALLPASLHHHGPSEIRAIAAALLPSLAQTPGLAIDAPEAAEPDLRAAIEGLPATLRGRVELRVHPEMNPCNLGIIWSGGSFQHDAAAAVGRVQAVLAELGLVVPHSERALIHG